MFPAKILTSSKAASGTPLWLRSDPKCILSDPALFTFSKKVNFVGLCVVLTLVQTLEGPRSSLLAYMFQATNVAYFQTTFYHVCPKMYQTGGPNSTGAEVPKTVQNPNGCV